MKNKCNIKVNKKAFTTYMKHTKNKIFLNKNDYNSRIPEFLDWYETCEEDVESEENHDKSSDIIIYQKN